mgnify:CR=1 FL=1
MTTANECCMDGCQQPAMGTGPRARCVFHQDILNQLRDRQLRYPSLKLATDEVIKARAECAELLDATFLAAGLKATKDQESVPANPKCSVALCWRPAAPARSTCGKHRADATCAATCAATLCQAKAVWPGSYCVAHWVAAECMAFGCRRPVPMSHSACSEHACAQAPCWRLATERGHCDAHATSLPRQQSPLIEPQPPAAPVFCVVYGCTARRVEGRTECVKHAVTTQTAGATAVTTIGEIVEGVFMVRDQAITKSYVDGQVGVSLGVARADHSHPAPDPPAPPPLGKLEPGQPVWVEHLGKKATVLQALDGGSVVVDAAYNDGHGVKHTHVVLDACWLVLVDGQPVVLARPAISTEIPVPAHVRVARWLLASDVSRKVFAACAVYLAVVLTFRLCALIRGGH